MTIVDNMAYQKTMEPMTEDDLACIIQYHPWELDNFNECFEKNSESHNKFWDFIKTKNYSEKKSKKLYKNFLKTLWINRKWSLEWGKLQKKEGNLLFKMP